MVRRRYLPVSFGASGGIYLVIGGKLIKPNRIRAARVRFGFLVILRGRDPECSLYLAKPWSNNLGRSFG